MERFIKLLIMLTLLVSFILIKNNTSSARSILDWSSELHEITYKDHTYLMRGTSSDYQYFIHAPHCQCFDKKDCQK